MKKKTTKGHDRLKTLSESIHDEAQLKQVNEASFEELPEGMYMIFVHAGIDINGEEFSDKRVWLPIAEWSLGEDPYIVDKANAKRLVKEIEKFADAGAEEFGDEWAEGVLVDKATVMQLKSVKL